MAGLRYVGRAPDNDSSIVHKKYVDDRYTVLKVDNAYINGEIATVGSTLTSTTYVDTADNGRAKKSAVDAADAGYLPVSQKGVANGVASIGSDGYIPSAQLPTLQTVRKPVFKNADTVFLSGTREVTTIALKEFRAATLTITDPGFPYQVLAFATVQGGAQNGTQPDDQHGTGNYGQINILREDDKCYGKLVTSGQKAYDYFTVHPYGAEDDTPTTYPALTGNTVLNLWIGLYGGTTYTFTSTNLVFYCLAYPVF